MRFPSVTCPKPISTSKSAKELFTGNYLASTKNKGKVLVNFDKLKHIVPIRSISAMYPLYLLVTEKGNFLTATTYYQDKVSSVHLIDKEEAKTVLQSSININQVIEYTKLLFNERLEEV